MGQSLMPLASLQPHLDHLAVDQVGDALMVLARCSSKKLRCQAHHHHPHPPTVVPITRNEAAIIREVLKQGLPVHMVQEFNNPRSVYTAKLSRICAKHLLDLWLCESALCHKLLKLTRPSEH